MTTESNHDAATNGERFRDRTSGGRARFDWRSLVVSVAAAAALSALPILPGFAGEAQAQRLLQFSAVKRTSAISVSVGKSEDVRTDTAFVDIAVGDAEIADVNPLTDKALSILGKKIGTTRVSIYAESKKLIGVFDVEVTYDVSRLAEELARRFPTAKFRVSSVNGRILLSGNAPDGIVLDQALTVARQFGPEVINSVQVDAPQQVMLEVRFVEASRQAGRELGVQWNASESRFLTNIGTERVLSKPSTAPNLSDSLVAGVIGTATAPFGLIAGRLIANGLPIDVLLNALEERGLARRLAEPNLVALSGDTANFLAGGEYPIPISGSLGQISVEYKRYGVSLAFTPTVLNAGQINLKIEPEVSQLDNSRSVSVGAGILVPALTVRRASSTIELRDGQSFVLAGLLQNDTSALQHQLPWLGDVPIIGTLFSSKAYQKNETDLVIVVTPRIVRPSRPGDMVRTPLDNTLAANDADFFLKGKAEVLRTEVRNGGAPVARPFTGHMLDLPKGASYAAIR